MKIGIITFSRSQNFGAVLQTYALWRFLEEHGQNAEIIDYVPERCAVELPSYVDYRTSHSRIWGKNALLKTIWKTVFLKEDQESHEHFFRFLRENVKLTCSYYSNDELKKNCPNEDIYITGSDQVWNTDFTWDHTPDLPYFLDFVPDEHKKISYASSFGRESIPENCRDSVRSLLSRYSAVSVREESGVEILKSLGIASMTVLDPTFLLTADEWNSLIKKQISQKYLLVFVVHPNKDLVRRGKILAERLGVALKVCVSTRRNRRKIGSVSIRPDVEEWIALIKNASYIITDSFHATAFSIQFHRQFIVDGSVKYNTRLQNILSKLEINGRSIDASDIEVAFDTLNSSIDYKMVDENLYYLRTRSREWLLSQME